MESLYFVDYELILLANKKDFDFHRVVYNHNIPDFLLTLPTEN